MTPAQDRQIPFTQRIRVRLVSAIVLLAVCPFALAVLALLTSLPESVGSTPHFMLRVYVLGSILVVVCVAMAWRFADKLLSPLLKIRGGAEIVSRINLSHRIDVTTGDELESLAADFNSMAEALEGAYSELEERVREVTVSLQGEKSRLASVLRTMVEGLVVLNEQGEVLLMNPRARAALCTGSNPALGRKLTQVLPAKRVEYHLKQLRLAWEEGRRDMVEPVIFPLVGGRLLKGVMAAMPEHNYGLAGYLLAFRDLTEEAERDKRVDMHLRKLPSMLRSPLSSMQSLAEILETRKDLPEEKRKAFAAALHGEANACLKMLGEGEEVANSMPSALWPGQPADAHSIVAEALAASKGVYAELANAPEHLPPVAAEPFGWVAAMSTVIGWLASHSSGWSPVVASIVAEGEMVVTTFSLAGAKDISPDEMNALVVEVEGEEPITLYEAVRRNRGEIWTRSHGEDFEVRLGMVKASQLPEADGGARIVDDQPEFYDFDLFQARPGFETGDLLSQDLAKLEFVVFDTETTGLSPAKGDKVVSLSGVRVRRGKVLSAGVFHTLVDPGIPIPPESVKFHGVTDEMVAGAPKMAEAFEDFKEYVGDAVIVAHNAAFDMKFLELAARENDLVSMDNPVIDTLFLSFGVHGDLQGHSLDAISDRLGVTIEGRHTSLGDARATAEILVKLIPLLAARGVRTLAEAKAFCDRMLILRWQNSRY